MNRFYLTSFFILIGILLAACSQDSEGKKNEDTLSVYTTVYPLQYFTERIGGDEVEVFSIYPPGSDEHTFDPTQKDMMALADADLFFYIGLGLEGFVSNAEKTLANEHVRMIATAETITEDMLESPHDDHEDHHHHTDLDPHVWISPALSDALAYSIKEALIEAHPQKEDEFQSNFEALRDDLLELDRQFLEMASKAKTKTFFVSHAAFGYLADAYGLNQVSVAGLNSQSEPSQKELASLVELAKEEDVRYIFFEQNVSSNVTKVIQKEIGAEALMLHNLGVLTEDDIKNEEDYFSLMTYNLDMLEKALNE